MVNALLIAAALGYALMLLVRRREMSWPPRELLSSLDVLSGSLAMVGPLVLWRRSAGEGGLGELAWLVGGLLIWLLDLVAVAEDGYRGVAWATPIGPERLGPIALAVLVGGWRTGRSPGGWTWTNVVGWLLGLVWISLGVAAMLPGRAGVLGFAGA